MALFSKKPKTSTQKAQKAQMGIFVRLVGCAYLIYVVVQLLTTAPEDDSLSPTLKIVISVFFLLAAAAVIFITVLDFIRNLKSGTYKTASYTDDIISAYAENDESESFTTVSETDGGETTDAPAEAKNQDADSEPYGDTPDGDKGESADKKDDPADEADESE